MSQLSDYQRMVEQPHIDRLTAKFQQQHAARYAAEARVRVLEEALETAIRVAGEAREEWDAAPSGMKAGKLLIALSDPSLNYRAEITAMHSARAALARGSGNNG